MEIIEIGIRSGQFEAQSNRIMSGWVILGYPGISTIAHCWLVRKVNNLENRAAGGATKRAGRLDSRRTAASHSAYWTGNPQISQSTPRGALFPLGYGHAARRKHLQGLGIKTNSAKSDIHWENDVLQVKTVYPLPRLRG